ncbi:MAG TPA: mandelate racemase/muconate lactonizing enzyme family protein [Xanthobacteraceae bacterium]|jgi:L-alanine-DL-glutamate epimerase-like enolase superfamily enzyme|nr:mandelate racemase/muconate lactonizing enzyme family protein [Xanthobacteraceae bacterium]
MKIVKFEEFHVDCGWEIYAFLKVSTDEGITGWSEFSGHRRPGIDAAIHGMGQMLIGQDPRAINRIDALTHSFTRPVPGGLNQNAAGAILNACLDIKGKALGVPVYELLGGAVRDRIPVYWSRCGVIRARCAEFFDGKVIDKPAVRTVDDLIGAAREARDNGYKAIKTNLLVFDQNGGRQYTPGSSRGEGHPELNLPEDKLDALLAQLSALREGAGPDVRIAVDVNFNYKAEGFRRIARKVEPFDLMWLEMDMCEPNALAAIRASTRTPIASLETILGCRALRPYLDAHCADVAIVDPQYNGVPEAVRMAAMCDTYEVNVASHYFSGPLSAIICAHFAAVIPNLRISEYDVDEVPWKPKLLTHPPVIENGHFVVPTGPGWGTDVNEDELRAHAPKK